MATIDDFNTMLDMFQRMAHELGIQAEMGEYNAEEDDDGNVVSATNTIFFTHPDVHPLILDTPPLDN